MRYSARQESLSTVDGCILFGDRLVIPDQHRKRCLRQLHQGHPGIHRMKAIARSYVYWPSLDDEITAYVKECKHCASVMRSPAHSAPVPWPRPTGPWKRIHVDFAGPIEGDYFLLVIDAFSKWPEIVRTRRITSAATIGILRNLFARLGMPETLVSDNGTQLTSAEFEQFCESNGIQHITTAPFHPQSNGQAERFVDTFKRAVKKIGEGRSSIEEALDIFLLTYRTTPNRLIEGGMSPSEVMFGLRTRTNLDLLRPPPMPPAVPVQQDEGHRKRCFDQHDLVFAKLYINNKWRWAPGVICGRIGQVMYTVWVEDRKLIRSHVNQLRSRTDSMSVGDLACEPRPLPLDILLDTWNLPKSSSASSGNEQLVSPANAAPSGQSSQSSGSPFSPTCSASPTISSASSTSVTSLDFASADSGPPTPVPVLPRRSSRNRRLPQWFDPYHLY